MKKVWINGDCKHMSLKLQSKEDQKDALGHDTCNSLWMFVAEGIKDSYIIKLKKIYWPELYKDILD